jgi:putative DNA primase/helicase
VQFKKDDIGQMIEFIAHQKENSYHPVKEYLESLNYDSSTDEPFADLWLERFCTVKKTENEKHTKLIREMGRAWLISAVARIYEPGCKVDCSLIFLGKQGIGKSTVFRYLAKKDEWFSDSAIDIRGGRDSYSKLRGKWIYEFAELSSTKNRDSTVTKSFLSSQSDSYRPAYARYEIDQKRQVVFCGSSNELEIFRDVTGDRRFYPIALENVDFEALKKNVDKIWAHAVYLYKKGDPWRLVERDGIDYEKLLSEYQEPYKATDSWMEAINNSPLIGTQKGWSLKELLEQILDIQPPQQNRAVLMRLSGLLSGAGWIKYRSYDKDTKKNRYLWKRG